MNKDCTCYCKTSILQPTPDPKLQEPELNPVLLGGILILLFIGSFFTGYGIAAFIDRFGKAKR
jgi:hypothetical protein